MERKETDSKEQPPDKGLATLGRGEQGMGSRIILRTGVDISRKDRN